MITIELFDGTRLEFPDGTSTEVINRVAKEQTQRRPGVIAEIGDGKVTRAEDGSLSFSSPGYSTNDPATIERLMQGDNVKTIVRQGFQDQAISDKPVAARAAAAIKGVPFAGQYADEIVGSVSPKARDAMQFAQDAMAERKPGQTMALQLGTGLAATLPFAIAAAPSVAAAAPSSMAGRVGAGTVAGLLGGGLEGAVSGYGAGTDAESRKRKAVEYGLIGAGTGAAIGGALPMVSSGVRRGANYLMDQFNRTSRVLPGLSKEASDQLMIAAAADNIGTDGAANIARGGASGMVADAGPAMGSLADRAVNMSSQGAKVAGDAIEGRANAAAGALGQSFDDAMGGVQGVNALSRDIRSAAKPGISAAYRQAYSTAIDYASDAGRKIEGLVRRLPKGITRTAIDKANARMVFDGNPNMQILAEIADDGTVSFREMPNVMQLDYIKRAFDQIAEDGFDPQLQRYTSDAAFAKKVAAEIRGALKDAVPAYGTALSNAADEFALQRATRLGETIIKPNTTREAVSDWLQDAGKLERAAAVRSLRSSIDEIMANARRAAGTPDGTSEARKIFGMTSSRAARDKIEMILGKTEAAKVFKALDEAEKSLELRAMVARGSDTAPRAKGDAALQASEQYSPSGLARDAASGGWLSTPKRVLEIAAGNTPTDKLARNEETYRQIAEFLVRQGPQAEQAARQMGGLLNYVGSVSPVAASIGRNAGAALGSLGYLSGAQALRK